MLELQPIHQKLDEIRVIYGGRLVSQLTGVQGAAQDSWPREAVSMNSALIRQTYPFTTHQGGSY